MAQKILAVDDEPNMLRLLERIITEKTPFQFASTPNSLEVESMLEQEEFDLVITDLKMPGKDGLDILRFIRESHRHEEVIIITAFGSMDSASRAMSQGVFDYITKPFKKEEILHTINRAMRWQQMKRDAGRFDDLLNCEPFDEALEQFQVEYVKRLAAKCGHNHEEVARVAQLPIECVRAILDQQH